MYIKTDLTDEQKATLQKLFRRPFIEPHVVAQQLLIRTTEAIALLDRLVNEYPAHFARKYLIYHYCSEAPVGSLADGKTIRGTWTCPECEEEVDACDLKLEFVYKAYPVSFVNSDDGKVRYWRVDYFPYYVKGFSPNRDPALVLLPDDAEMFDEILDKWATSREKDLDRVELQYRDYIEETVENLC
jgi:hypothetical protein